jgi:hypothetical protein
MDGTLFSDRSLWTMFHGIALSGGALVGLAIALFSLTAMRPTAPPGVEAHQPRARATLLTGTAVALWLAVLVGTYVVFPLYRATPPAGAASLADYPRALLLADPGTAWLHAFAMESKEHMPWIAAMLATAAAFVGVRDGAAVLSDAPLRRMVVVLLGAAFVLTSFVGLLGILVNKVAPLQ